MSTTMRSAPSEQPRVASLNDLPYDVLSMVFAHFRPCDIPPLACVNKRWHTVVISHTTRVHTRALAELEHEYAVRQGVASIPRIGMTLTLDQCPASPLYTLASPLYPNPGDEVAKFEWHKSPPAIAKAFYVEMKAAIASGSWKLVNAAFAKFGAVHSLEACRCNALSWAALYRWPELMRKMVAKGARFANSAHSCASLSGDAECAQIALEMSRAERMVKHPGFLPEERQSHLLPVSLVDSARSYAAMAAGGHWETLRSYLMHDKHGQVGIGWCLEAAASRGKMHLIQELLKHISTLPGRFYIPWTQILCCAVLCDSNDEVILLCMRHGAQVEAAVEIAMKAGKMEYAKLLS